MKAKSQYLSGFFEDALSSCDNDPIAKFLELNQRITDYKTYLSSIQLPESVSQFINQYVLGTNHPKGLHDEEILRFTSGGESGDGACYIDISLDGMKMSHSFLRITYLGVVDATPSSGHENSFVVGHDIVGTKSHFQHSIYVLGRKPIRVAFGNLKTEIIYS